MDPLYEDQAFAEDVQKTMAGIGNARGAKRIELALDAVSDYSKFLSKAVHCGGKQKALKNLSYIEPEK